MALKTLVFEVEEGQAGQPEQRPRQGVQRQQQAIMEAAVAASVDHKNVVGVHNQHSALGDRYH